MLLRRFIQLLLAIIIAFAAALAQQPVRKIARIEVVGLQRLTPEEVIATTGLKTGQPFSVEGLDAAGQRLVDSGLFEKVGYLTTTKANQITVTFQVEEAKGGQSAVVFDNFVWFTNDELIAAIKREVPSFNGSAPDAGRMTDDIKRALQSLLKEHAIDGGVDYAPWQKDIGARQEHLFSVTGVPIPICSLHFPGAKNVSEEKLVRSSRQLTEADYSQKATVAFGTYILFPLYRAAGQLRARFAEPIAKLDTSTNCKGGVELTIPVEEGPIYLWDKAVWTDQSALSPQELDAALGMKNGELANGVKIDRGMLEVVKRYGSVGHLDINYSTQPEFDDNASRVTFKIAVKEGPQYRMGKLSFKGLSEEDAQALSQKWKLKTDQVFDTSYFDRFFKTDAREEMQKIFSARQAAGRQPPDIKDEIIRNRPALTADVIIEFKN
jgi:outer membrane protein assembly factor BamA